MRCYCPKCGSEVGVMGAGLTRAQKRVFDFIEDYMDEHGVAPSFDDIKDGVGLASKSVVHRHVQTLIQKGWIGYMPDRARSIYLIPQVGDAPPLEIDRDFTAKTFGDPIRPAAGGAR